MGDIEDVGRAHILRVLVNVVPRASTCSRSYVSEYHTLDLTFISGWVFRNSLSTAQVNLTLATAPLFLAPSSSAVSPNLPLLINSETHPKFNLLRCTTSTSYHAPSTEERAAGQRTCLGEFKPGSSACFQLPCPSAHPLRSHALWLSFVHMLSRIRECR
ncbi:hypothetical protein BD626DRAFT_529403 [Schizophyllum amplum]|uniref:Uncharacterized protein n=1 Tax=Schizophyllum amplum TaxID=97359 RepID=A0A550BRX1_9AGAR|nr:hypothetical protein BD626DRAFT_529403 [Auriculariopsis ampla]